MGTYYRIVCGEHKEVLDLSKMWELKHELGEFVDSHHLQELEYDGRYKLNENMKEICKKHIDKLLTSSKPRCYVSAEKKEWILKHIDCTLFFQSDAESWEEQIDEGNGWKWIDIFEDTHDSIASV